jgi:hypothetical protein
VAAHLEAVWNDPHADGRLRKQIVRTLTQKVVVDVDAAAGEIILMIHWKGGVHTELRVPGRRRGQNSSQAPTEIVEAVRVLARLCSDDVLAGALNPNSLFTGRGNRCTRERVGSREHFVNSHRLRDGPQAVERVIAIVDPIPTRLVPRKGFAQPLGRPPPVE